LVDFKVVSRIVRLLPHTEDLWTRLGSLVTEQAPVEATESKERCKEDEKEEAKSWVKIERTLEGEKGSLITTIKSTAKDPHQGLQVEFTVNGFSCQTKLIFGKDATHVDIFLSIQVSLVFQEAFSSFHYPFAQAS
jgi:hypothetical protein